MKTRNLLFAVAAIAMAACSNENETVMSPVALTVNADITDVNNTRVSGTSFSAGNTIGVSVKATEGSTTGTNKKYTAETSDSKIVFNSTDPIYFVDAKSVTFSAYYPYSETVTADAPEITRNTTGQTASDANQDDYDFLYDTADGSVANSGISMTFSHMMSKLTLTFVAGKGVESDNDFFNKFTGTYDVIGLIHNGKFNTSDGTTSFVEGAVAEKITPAVPAQNTDVTDKKETKSSSIIIYPQPATSVKVALTYNSVNYVATLSIPDGVFAAGNNYSYTVTLNQTGLTISSADITDWADKDKTGVSAEYDSSSNVASASNNASSAASSLAYDGEEDMQFAY